MTRYAIQTGPSGIAAIEDVGEPSDEWPEPDETEEETETIYETP